MSEASPLQTSSHSNRVELAPGVRVPASALRFRFARSGGPGGQNVNKLNTKAELWIALSDLPALSSTAMDRLRTLAGRRITLSEELHISSESERTQERNREEALQRLRELLVRAMTIPKKRKPTKPSKAAKQRRLQGKKRRSEIKSRRRGSSDEW
ncbi:MAG TPA: alternative ribosome rescue aminoacyl-tRNA hydrolase ArfB [Tepidisphaeraceae bacterium]|nr:alternative ribosome rescue aminoacyl-tRNA hydrolase ArfB [Tepidisphaeraceae bacterium]